MSREETGGEEYEGELIDPRRDSRWEERARAMQRDADRLDRGEIRPLSSLSMRAASQDFLTLADLARRLADALVVEHEHPCPGPKHPCDFRELLAEAREAGLLEGE